MPRWLFKEKGPDSKEEGRGSSPEPSRADVLPHLVRRLLRNRGITTLDHMRSWLSPDLRDLHDPFLLPDLDVAAARIDRALRANERIFVFGDYDVDGITSAALLKRQLDRWNGNVRLRIPARLTEGYGLSAAAIDEAAAWEASLLISADCGTTALEEVRFARARGIDVIVSDHHLPGPDLPDAVAVVNPRREGSAYPFPELAAVGVSAKILEGVHRLRAGLLDACDPVPPPLRDFGDLVALGTIADGVSIEGENRILVRHGLRLMRSNPRAAVAALARATGIDPRRIGSADIAFQFAPRLNAAGRLGDAEAACDLLLCDDPGRCEDLVSTLETHNARRRELLDRVIRDVASVDGIEESAARGEPIILESGEWHPGVVGIAAARIAETYGVPAIILAGDGSLARGSGRATGDIDLLDLIRAGAPSLVRYGGHRSAVGLTVEIDKIPHFREEILNAARGKAGMKRKAGDEGLEIDARVTLPEIDLKLLDWLDRFEPFGPGNREPVLAVRARVAGEVRVLKGRHLRFDITGGGVRHECIAFGRAEDLPGLETAGGEIHLAVVPSRNVYHGEVRLQLQVRDIALVDPFGNG